MYSNQFIIEKQSPFDVPDTVKKIIEAAVQKDWQNPATHDLQNSLAKSGKTVRPVQVVEICKPEYSGKMLERNHERIVSVMMPCRISVYEKEDGKTYVALMDMSKLSVGMPAEVANAMLGASDETFEIVKSVIGSF
jgi:uncharacterized protein (DUF302 family)